MTAGPVGILGLDPGLQHTGWGLIESHGSRLRHLAGGVAQADVITGTAAPDELVGTYGSDSIFGLGAGDLVLDDPAVLDPGADDSMYGGPGNDGIFAELGDDAAFGGPGDDDVSGGVGGDLILGNDGDDYVDDGPAFDTFSDALYGGAGDDTLDAFNDPPVADSVVCGPGEDLVFTDGTDLIADDCETVVRGPDPDSDDLQYDA